MDERALIQEAINNLVAGNPTCSDGKLTVVNLAKEAGLHRQRLYADHSNLVEEFKTLTRTGVPTGFAQQLQAAERTISQLKTANAELAQKVDSRDQEIATLSALVVELAHQQTSSNVSQLRTQRSY